MKIISHRGYWQHNKDKNTRSAFVKAIDSNFGIETDFRDFLGKLVISHDPPTKPGLLAKDFFSLCEESSSKEVFALNVKSDGLQDMFEEFLALTDSLDYFLFDMSVPDALGYIDRGMCVFTRQSEWEMIPSFYQESCGVWIDSFKDDAWVNDGLLSSHIDAGKRICIVSPELHCNCHRSLWSRLSLMSESVTSDMILCTDLPDEARSFFCAQS